VKFSIGIDHKRTYNFCKQLFLCLKNYITLTLHLTAGWLGMIKAYINTHNYVTKLYNY